MLTIRLRRMGSKKRPRFRVVVIDGHAARDGRFIEVLGHYNPQTQPEVLHVDHERLAHWLQQGRSRRTRCEPCWPVTRWSRARTRRRLRLRGSRRREPQS